MQTTVDIFAPNDLSPIEQDLRVLSSGTLSTLSGQRHYRALDAFQFSLIEAYRDAYAEGHRFESWVDFVTSKFAEPVITEFSVKNSREGKN